MTINHHELQKFKEITFYFDFLSPFSYFSWPHIQKMSKEPNIKIVYRPVALGPILNHWGIKGPGEVQPKREFLLKQMLRYAHKNNILFTTPKTHPFNSLYALRLSLFSVAGIQQEQVIDSLWKAGWQRRIDLGNPDDLIDALKQDGLPAQELYEKSFLPEAKKELKTNINLALEHKVFGVPSFVVESGQELFWGVDSMNELNDYLKGTDVLDKDKYEFLLKSTPRAAEQNLTS